MISFDFVAVVYLLAPHVLFLPQIAISYSTKGWWSLKSKLLMLKNIYPAFHDNILSDSL